MIKVFIDELIDLLHFDLEFTILFPEAIHLGYLCGYLLPQHIYGFIFTRLDPRVWILLINIQYGN